MILADTTEGCDYTGTSVGCGLAGTPVGCGLPLGPQQDTAPIWLVLVWSSSGKIIISEYFKHMFQ
jgi:hypothetical protein